MLNVFSKIEDFARSLPVVKERAQQGRKAYEVGKKVFIILDEQGQKIVVRIAQKKQQEYESETGFFNADIDDKGSASIGVDLNIKKDIRLLKELVVDSFHSVANKKALNKLYNQFPQ